MSTITDHDDNTCICGCEAVEHAPLAPGGRDIYRPAQRHDECLACTECHDGFLSLSDAAEQQGMARAAAIANE